MSETIDRKVVEMKFDNGQFENNVRTSMSTLEKLKEKLNLTGATKGLESVNDAARKVNLNGIGSAVETVSAKFSAMQVVGITALANITNKAVDAGERMIKALTIDPVKTGFQEYETQIGAIQTILANTESKGSTLQDVNRALDELNTYADKTIYNFTEMTRNIGTFTAAGVDLDTSVSSIKGIANLAAVSGSTSQQASTAMYQLSQAIAAGKVQLMDWNSVVNAGMGGEVFQNALKRTATNMGTNVDALIKKYGSFRESLTKGEWLTTEVLTETLTQLSGAYTKADLIAQGYTEQQAEDIAKLADTAVSAATEVKTFTQLWDTLKEAAQSGWTQSWQTIIGDFGEAKELLTTISDTVGAIIQSSADARNSVLTGGLSTGWKQLLNEGITDEDGFKDTIKLVAKDHGVAVDDMIKKNGSFEKSLKEGWLTGDILTESLNKMTKKLKGLSDEQLKEQGYTKEQVRTLRKLNKSVKDGTINMDEFAEKMTKASGRENMIDGLKNVFVAILDVIKPVNEAFREIFPPLTAKQLYDFTVKFKTLTERLKVSGETANNIKRIFKGFFSVLDIGVEGIKAFGKGAIDLIKSFSGLDLGILDTAASLGDYLTNLRNGIIETNVFGDTVNRVVRFLTNIIDRVKNFGKAININFDAPSAKGIIGVFEGLWNIITSIGSKIPDVLSSVLTGISNFLGKGDIFEVLNSGIFAAILLGIKKFTNGINDSLGNVNGVLENVTGILDDVRGCFKAYQDQLKAGTLMKIATAIGVLAASLFVISTIDEDSLSKSLGAITILFAELMGSLALFGKMSLQLTATTKAVGLMNGMAIAILVLSFALRNISSLDTGGIVKGLVAIGVLMAELAIFLNTAKFGGKVKSTAVGIVILASALLILSKAVEYLGGMDVKQLTQGLISVGVLLAEIMAFTKLTSGSKGMVSIGVGLVLIGASMKIFASAISDLGSMNTEQLTRGLTSMSIALVAIAGATRLMPKNMIGIGTGLLIVSAALLVLYKSLNGFSGMSWEEIGRGLAAMAGSLLVLSIALMAMNGTLAGSAALLIAAGALTIFAPVLKSLGSMSWEEVAKGLVILAGAFAVIGVAGLLLSPIIPAILGLAAAFALFGVAALGIGTGILAISAGLTALATAGAAGATAIVAAITVIVVGLADLIPTIAEKLGEAITAFAVVIGESAPQLAEAALKLIASVLESLGKYTPQIVESLLTLLIDLINGLADHMPKLISAAVNLIGSLLRGIIDALNGIDSGNLFKTIVSVTLLTGLTYALSGVVALIPSAMVGVLGLGAIIAELGLVLAAIGGLAQIPGLQWLVSEGGNFLQTVGTAIGQFIGGIVGGVAKGFTASLPQIGFDLSLFMTSITPFIAGIKMVDSSVLEGAGYLSGAIIALSVADFVNGVTSLIPFTGSFSDLGTQLSLFMINLTPFIVGIKTLDENSVNSAHMLAETILVLSASKLISGITSILGLGSTFDSLGTQLASFGKAIVAFSNAISAGGGINEDAVKAAATAGNIMIKLQEKLPSTGGVVQWITGQKDLGNFGTQLVLFGTAISHFSRVVSEGNINETAVQAAATAGSIMVELQSKLPNTSGVVQFFTGQKSLSTFGANLVAFGDYLVQFSDSVSGLNVTSVTAAATAGTMMASVQKSIPDKKWFDGKVSLPTFGKQMASFGKHMSNFSENVSDINAGAVDTVVSTASRLVTLVKRLENLDTSGISSFKTAISELASIDFNQLTTNFSGGVTNFASMGTSLTTALANGITAGKSNVVSAVSSVVLSMIQAVSAKTSSMSMVGKNIVSGITAGIDSRRPVITVSVNNLITAMTTGIRSRASMFRTLGVTLITNFANGISANSAKAANIMKTVTANCVTSVRGYYTNFYSAGSYLVDGFKNGISENTFKAEATATVMAKAALEAAKEALDEHSPSKAMYEVGAYAGQGFVNALSDYAGTAYDYGYTMADSARIGLSTALAKVQELIDSNMDIQPVIRPVIDLSAVQNGSASIAGMIGQTVQLGTSTALSSINTISAAMNQKNQNGGSDEVVRAIDKLSKNLSNVGNTYNSINGLSYTDDLALSTAFETIVKAARLERRM